ncbi:MAG: mechanosensitive ion channel family protein [Desulfobulbaceae bacterium]|uniref:Mechanosensitive ion channel family protein n=1 Tax=Candidatus Desulfatifera sulfidica TaxID=2841691 RepID=A0A8J6NBT4_9BACT|nr:mechanosensitive ion channel family protein [Candidatus Desulfatifera sulfidica]
MDQLTILLERFPVLQDSLLFNQILVVVVYAVLAKLVDLFITRILKRFVARTRISFDDVLISFLHSPICWTIVLLGVQHALVMQVLPPPWQTVLPALAKSLMLLLWLSTIIRIVNRMAEQNLVRILGRGKIGNDLFLLLKNVVRFLVVIAGLLWLLSIWQVDLTPLFASAGIAGIAVALAAKDTLANFFGGISIFMDNTFKVGDYIIIDSGERGEVVEVGIRSTRIKTRDDVLITIPNAILANSKIINESAPVPAFRIRVPVGVAYGSDLDQVEKILLAVAGANDNVALDPAPRVRMRLFGDSSVDFELLCWVDDPRVKGLETHQLLKEVYRVFGEQGISIPFPQRDVHLVTGAEVG